MIRKMTQISNYCVIVLEVLLVLCLYHTVALGYYHVIIIDPLHGNDTDSCIQGKESCQSLEWTFKSDHRQSSTKYVLNVGTHFLRSVTEDFEGLQFLAFIGNTNDSNEVIIQCTGENTGLGFINITNATFSNLTINNCAALRNSSSRDYSTNQTYQSLQFQVGLYFYLCKDVTLLSVMVNNSPSATGVVMYDVSGTNQIADCQFYNNSVFYPVEDTASPHGGGGGLYVEFTYCNPGSSDCSEETHSTNITGSEYWITECAFICNVANDSITNPLANYIVPNKADHMAFGRGGGLSVFINGYSNNNTFNVTNCNFTGNEAAWGGGMFLEFHDHTYNNNVSIAHSFFQANKCHYTPDSGTAGGGMRIGLYVYEKTSGMGNSVNIDTCTFYGNSALNGGGLSISAALHDVDKKEELTKVTVNSGTFVLNTARLGAGLHVDGFPLFLIGQILTVIVINCHFYGNSVDYLDPLGLQNVIPYQPGEGTVYIHGVPVEFQQSVTFFNNIGSGLAVVKAQVDFSNTDASFRYNSGNHGGGIALLGAAYIVISSNTSMEFIGNNAAITGGAIYNKYISRRTLGSYADCFIRYTNPLIHANEWNATFVFHLNRDLGGSNDNAIHSTSLLPCSWAGKNRLKIFCWRGWTFLDTNGTILQDCTKMVSSDIGNISFNQGSNRFKSFPGQPFNLHLDIKDDSRRDMNEETVFLASTNTSGSALGVNGSLYSYIWGTNTTIWGESGNDITLQLNTITDRVWHLELFVDLQQCPPGFILVKGDTGSSQLQSCRCSGDYGRALICDDNYFSARLMNGFWMGNVSDSSIYFSTQCPAGFCYVEQNFSHFFLPNNSDKLEKLICGSMNRRGVLCGRCVEDYGPAVNSPMYDCINCTDPVGDTLKYISAVYIPLAVMFLLIILFNVRLTTGAANSFILYAQVISSTFSVDADGQIPLNLIAKNHTRALLKAYSVPYGVFNLEFIENLIPLLCIKSQLNTLTVISLDYAVALAPLVMIVIATIIFRVSSCIADRCCKRSLQPEGVSRAKQFLTNKKRSLSEALLPAFSAFLLLSYTKLALTPSYILVQAVLVDNNGNKTTSQRPFFAGHMTVKNHDYILYYVVPAVVVFATFVAIPPLLLLDYPLRLFEWCLSKVTVLWRRYPVGKVHFFLDTFQGCFKNNCRFFAGLYFLFRLVINVTYSFSPFWLEQFIVQEIICILMITMLSLFQPYNEQNKLFNRIDVLMFTNLAVVNGLSFYLFEYNMNNPKADTLPVAAFVIEYILIFLPLIYMISYVLWVKTKPWHRQLPCIKRTPVNNEVLEESCDTLPPNDRSTLLDSNSYIGRRFEDSEDAFFRRAQYRNLYMPPSNHKETRYTREYQQKNTLASRTRQTMVSEDSGLRSVISGSGKGYGSTISSSKESTGASIDSKVSFMDNDSILYQSDDNSDNES